MSDGGAPAVEHTLRIGARPETVWRYWTDPERLCRWWGVEAQLEPEPGGICRIDMGDGRPVMRGQYLELVPHRRLVFSFGWEVADGAPPVPPGSTRVEVTLEEADGDTIVTVRHHGLPGSAVEAHRTGWERYLPALAEAAAG